MTRELVNVDQSQHEVAIVTLMRAEKRNALNVELLQQLASAIQDIEQNPRCRVMILRGDGAVFCAGLDLVEAATASIETTEASAEGIRHVLALLHESRLVVIGAATGGAYAGGAGLLAACDLVVTADDFQIGFPETRRGLVAAIIGGYLARKVRDGDLRQLLLLGEPVDALRAQQMGLVQFIVPGDQVLEKARSLSQICLAGGPDAVRETKQLLNRDPGSIPFHELQSLHERIRQGSEASEGLAAFRERREPNWHWNS